MTKRTIGHLKRNAIAYLALFFALGGGTGALAATSLTSGGIHGCVNKRSGVLYVAKRCSHSERTLVFGRRGPAGPAGPAGAPAAVAFGQVLGGNFLTVKSRGLTLTKAGTGLWDVSVSATCQETSSITPVVTPVGADNGFKGPPVAFLNNAPLQVETGYYQNGAFVQADQDFNIVVECY